MRILLVNPESPETFWSFKYALTFLSRKAILPPLGLLTVASMLPQKWERRLVDMAETPLNDEDILWADYVFITAMAIQKASATKVIERCKNLGVKTVAGGPLFTSAPELFDDVDHLVLNEAELTLPLFLKDIEQNTAKPLYSLETRAELKETPVPSWSLVNMNKYMSMCIQYSRGCPFSCDFCDVTRLFGNKMRTKTTDQMLHELDELYNYGWRGQVFIVDDNFIGNKRQIKNELLPAMIDWMKKRKYPFSFNTQVSINLADDDLLMELLAKAGFDTVFIGIETPHDESLDECNKTQNRNRDLLESVKKIQSYGLQVQGGFILGFDSDRDFIFDKLTAFIQQSGIVTAMVGLLNAPRGTQLYKRMQAEERLLKDSTGDNTDLSMNFIPKMDHQELIDGYRNVVCTIYSQKIYCQRILTLLRNYKPKKQKGFAVDLCGIKALVKSAWFLGIREKGKFYYWKLILWTLFRRPQSLQLAVSFAITGFHFRKIFANY
jgi:radical SAM superfamily enzyme YgiQ (UPF0313 family)